MKYQLLSFLVGLIELLGISLVYPFIYKLVNPAGSFDIKNLFFALIIVVVFLLKNVFMFYYSSLQTDFTLRCGINISQMFIKYFLWGDYVSLSKIPYSEKSQILNYIIPNGINNFVLRTLNLTVNLFVFVLILTFLFVKFFYAAIITLIFAIFIVSVLVLVLKNKTENLSKDANLAKTTLLQFLNNTLLNTKNMKISNAESVMYDRYVEHQENIFVYDKKLLFYNIISPYLIEPLIIVMLLVLLFMISIQNLNQPASLIASYALVVTSLFRLAPIVNRIQTNIVGINSHLPLVKELLDYYEKFNMANLKDLEKEVETIDFKQNLELKNVSFSYNDKAVLSDINLKINKGEFVGIVGLSGVGKTSLIDILSGLLKQQAGEYLVDGKDLSNTNKVLNIGYISQELGVISATFIENVTLGVREIDRERVVEVLKLAKLYDFIMQNYKDGIDANPLVDTIGLSQGQKQRLAIARALYNNPDIIILDEATSALDLKTEDEICDVLNNLRGDKTVIAVAHRLSTIKNADKIVFMENSTIADIGKFEELEKRNSSFRELVELSKVGLKD